MWTPPGAVSAVVDMALGLFYVGGGIAMRVRVGRDAAGYPSLQRQRWGSRDGPLACARGSEQGWARMMGKDRANEQGWIGYSGMRRKKAHPMPPPDIVLHLLT